MGTWQTLASLSFGNGLGLTLTYDNDGRPTDIDTNDGGSTTIQDLHLTYDAAGNITAVADDYQTVRNQSFTYDDVNRLTNGTGSYGNIDYAYDLVGNRTSRLVHGTPNITYASTIASTSNRLTSVSDGTTTRSFGYSASGDVTSDDQGSSPDYALTYNDNDRLASLTAGGAALATYTYDATEHRVIKTVSGGSGYTHHFMHDRAGQLIAESDSSGTVIREYIWLGGLPIGLVDSTSTPALYFIHADHLATPQKATNASKTLVWDAQVQPFGEIASVTGALTQLLQFPGQYHDAETGFNDNWHRTYDPSTGRYLQSDRIGLGGGANLYAYAAGNPLTETDRQGRFLDTLLDIGFIGYDLHKLFSDGGCNTNENLTALGLDVAAAIIPGVTGLGAAYRLGKLDLEALAAAGKAADRNGLSKAGRALQKHGDRPGSAFPRSSGGAVERNRQGQDVLEDILTDPKGSTHTHSDGTVDVTASDGRTARFDPNGKFVGFREP